MLRALFVSLAAAAPIDRPVPVVPSARVPRALIEVLEADYRTETKRAAHDPIPLELLRLTAEVSAGKPGVIEDDARWQFVPGGGTLDLAGVVAEVPGRFNVKISARTVAGEVVTPSRVYFVPRGRARTLDGEKFGDGCGTMLNITGAFLKRFGPRGFDVFSTAERYVSTLAGTFVLAAFDQKALQVGHATFTDSRWPKLLCE